MGWLRGERLSCNIQTGVEQNAAACQGSKAFEERSKRKRAARNALHAATAVDVSNGRERLTNHLAGIEHEGIRSTFKISREVFGEHRCAVGSERLAPFDAIDSGASIGKPGIHQDGPMAQRPWADFAVPLIPADHFSRREPLRDLINGVFRGRRDVDICLGERESCERERR